MEVPLLPLKLPEEQSILIVGALILKIQAWTFFVVLGIVHKLYFTDYTKHSLSIPKKSLLEKWILKFTDKGIYYL